MSFLLNFNVLPFSECCSVFHGESLASTLAMLHLATKVYTLSLVWGVSNLHLVQKG